MSSVTVASVLVTHRGQESEGHRAVEEQLQHNTAADSTDLSGNAREVTVSCNIPADTEAREVAAEGVTSDGGARQAQGTTLTHSSTP